MSNFEKAFSTDFLLKLGAAILERINCNIYQSYKHKLFVMVLVVLFPKPYLLYLLHRTPKDNLGNSRLVLYRLNGQDKGFKFLAYQNGSKLYKSN